MMWTCLQHWINNAGCKRDPLKQCWIRANGITNQEEDSCFLRTYPSSIFYVPAFSAYSLLCNLLFTTGLYFPALTGWTVARTQWVFCYWHAGVGWSVAICARWGGEDSVKSQALADSWLTFIQTMWQKNHISIIIKLKRRSAAPCGWWISFWSSYINQRTSNVKCSKYSLSNFLC